MADHSPTIAVTLGDPRGIGPEVMTAAIRQVRKEFPSVAFLVLGPEGFESEHDRDRSVGTWTGTELSAGTVSLDAIRAAVDETQLGVAHAVVTGPVHKPALWAAGSHLPGQTELLQQLYGVEHVGMLMSAESTKLGAPLRVLLATTHIALRDVPSVLTPKLLVDQTRLLSRSLERGWGIDRPRIALCALNPHASDGGLFGDEEERIMMPAIAELAAEGISVSGPIPADTVFSRGLAGEFDAIVAPYHDVGMGAFKTVAFGGGVNVTLGLPFPRTSPDHGTAFDIAGTGLAQPQSAVESIRLAIRLAQKLVDKTGANSRTYINRDS